MSDKSKGRQKKSSKLGSILLGIFIIAAITSVLSILILTRIQAEYDTYLKGSLETVLKTTVEATENWVDEKKIYWCH